VGRIYRANTEASKRYGFSVGDRVISLVKWGGNARYLSVDPSKLVRVPESVDPAAAVCLAETYLAAFQVLHRGQTNRIRYRGTSLKGKTILILGYAISNMGRAIAQLATGAGALQVFAMAKLKHFDQLTALGISPLNKDSLDWWETLSGKVDFIISCEEDVVALHYKLLKGNGQVVVVRNSNKEAELDSFEQRTSLVCRSNKRLQQNKTSYYDVCEEWDNNTKRCMLDLAHLVHLLEQNKIEPHVLDRISLSKVARAHQLIESKRLTGFIVCEPWLVAKSRAIRL
jgi:NADPH:quinone reductase-like Zn-dependent oxidoreductase